MNICYQKAEQLSEFMKMQQGTCYEQCHDDIFSVLDSLDFLSEKKLRFETPISTEWIDRDNYIYLYNNVGGNDYCFLNYVRLKSVSTASIWQWILLYTLPNMYDLSKDRQRMIQKEEYVFTDDYWHTLIDKIPIFRDSVSDISVEEEPGTLSLTEYIKLSKLSIQPLEIIFNPLTMTADVSFCSWNNWKGLISNHFLLHIKEDNTIEVFSKTYKTIVPYDCGLII